MVTRKNIRQLEVFLKCLLLAILAGGIWCGGSIFWSSHNLPKPVFKSNSEPNEDSNALVDALPLSAHKPIWDFDFRQQLIKPPPVPKPKVKPPPPSPPPPLPKLLGTFVDKNGAWGAFQTQKGQISVAKAGDHVGKLEVIRVHPKKVQLNDGRKTYSIELPKKKVTSKRKRRR